MNLALAGITHPRAASKIASYSSRLLFNTGQGIFSFREGLNLDTFALVRAQPWNATLQQVDFYLGDGAKSFPCRARCQFALAVTCSFARY
jgi:hypothetical protein